MDWTSVFVQDGNEDWIIPELMQRNMTTSRLAKLVHVLYDEDDDIHQAEGHRLLNVAIPQQQQDNQSHSTYNLRAVYFLSVNYILGVGCLGIPYAFARAGFVLCATTLLTVTVCSYMTVMWVAESGVRLEQSLAPGTQCHEPVSETSPMLGAAGHDSDDKSNNHQIRERYEVIELVGYFLGPFHKVVYQISLMALMYIGLLAYSQVFCGAVETLIGPSPSSDDAESLSALFGLPQLIFGIIAIPLSFMELDEQVSIQAPMAALRFVALFIIASGSITALLVDDTYSHRENPPFFAAPHADDCTMSYTFCFSGFGIAFSTSLFAQLFQHSVPGLLRPLKKSDNVVRRVPWTLAGSLLTTSSFYLLLGTTAASFFGANTRSSVNLNFSDFYFGLDPETTPNSLLIPLELASNVVVLFPALDTISVFPLIANTLGNNLFAAAGGKHIKSIAKRLVTIRRVLTKSTTPGRYELLSTIEKKKLLEEASHVASHFWRGVAAFPPLVVSLYASDLSFSLKLAGVAGIYVAFVAPAVLQLRSFGICPSRNIYSGWYSSRFLCLPVLCFALASLAVALLQIRDAISSGL